MMRAIGCGAKRAGLFALAVAAALAVHPLLAQAQQNPPPAATPAPAPAPAAAPAPAEAEQPPANSFFSREELEKLLAPIALYPDPLLAQLLPASAYPVQIVQAQRWLKKNKALVANNDFSGIDEQDWDPAVKALARVPDVMKKMSDDLDWTTDLGDAEVNQPQDVADVIQELRAKAEAAGTLKTTDQQTVETVEAGAPPAAGAPQGSAAPQAAASYITIQPTDPSTVYVPTYDPVQVYQPYTGIAPLLGFGAGVAVGALWNNNYWNWRTGAIYPPVWAGYSGWRGNVNTGNVNIGNNVNLGNVGNNVKPWRPNGSYRPGMGSKPGIGANRPGGVGRPGRPGGVGGAGRPGGIGGAGGVGGIGGVGGPGRPGGVGGVGGVGGAGGPGRPGGVGGVGGAGRPGGVGGVGGAGRPGGGQVANRPAGRPGGGRQAANRPATRPAGRPGGGPAGRPNISRPGSSAMGGMRMGGANVAFANRGAMSRGGMPGGFGGAGMRGGGGFGGAGMRGGGGGMRGGGGGMRGGGGGMRGGGGGFRGGGGRGGGRRSDMRLKHDIVLLGRLDDGLGFYRFVYNGGHTAYVGVMAQEVQTVAPEAVTRGPDGYFRVSYEKLGLPFETYARRIATGARLPSVRPVAHQG
jgi:Protein of unknown function (DUF3300)/Chaperone of endosialidase